MNPRLRAWGPDLAVGTFVTLLGCYEAIGLADLTGDRTMPWVFVAVGTGLAVGLSRRAPAWALALVWGTCGLQVVNGQQVMLTEVAVAGVAFGTARWGRPPVVWAGGLSIPVAALIGLLYMRDHGKLVLDAIGYDGVARAAGQLGPLWPLLPLAVGLGVLGLPWLAGLALRSYDAARTSRQSQVAAEEDAARAVRESEQAKEIATLREQQARMARDVHDVVGHSLAVILAQAESAQFLEDADTGALKETMANIATSARASLQDVRKVLSTTSGQQAGVRPGELDRIIDGVRASGHDVVSSEVGAPQPLPPELDVVAVRVLQEMLTNAIKHGRRDQPVEVEQHWEGDLRIEVRNVVDDHEAGGETVPIATEHAAGLGLDGMRRRLDSVGGRLDVRRREHPNGDCTYTATAWVPLRPVVR